MAATTETWRVGAIMNEPMSEVLRFCAWYLELGAEEVVVCFDNPADPAIEALQHHPQLRLIPCTDEFWDQAGIAPDAAFVKRQNAAMTHIYQVYSDGWFLNVDADELLFFKQGTIQDLLRQVPADAISARIQTAERLNTVDGEATHAFRLPMAYQQRKQIYGDDAILFGPRREGLVGHSQGKSIVRCGEPGLRLRQHWPRWGREGDAREVVFGAASGAFLLHLIGEDYDIWRSKLAWRCASRGFTTSLTERIEALLAAGAADEPLRDMFARLHGATDDRLDRMRAAGALLEVSLDLDELVARHLPGVVG
ncbi:glycosyltransferase family 2 protein [Phaeobacter sp.]|uniref:glycosyltransferase family 2 protein n=1 Tax=Phaeobacter sp. TaxID=1902409 RepID=UPI0025EAE6C6|nr:glycosyltransferase family 2 protein [Phaeobacter sp.]